MNHWRTPHRPEPCDGAHHPHHCTFPDCDCFFDPHSGDMRQDNVAPLRLVPRATRVDREIVRHHFSPHQLIGAILFVVGVVMFLFAVLSAMEGR
jgi:hypothetical protein